MKFSTTVVSILGMASAVVAAEPEDNARLLRRREKIQLFDVAPEEAAASIEKLKAKEKEEAQFWSRLLVETQSLP
jgi:hypothetical protein